MEERERVLCLLVQCSSMCSEEVSSSGLDRVGEAEMVDVGKEK